MTPALRLILMGVKPDADALLWRDAVVTNGGTVSGPRLAIVSAFIRAEKASGAWALTDDYWGLWGESEPQALTSLKQRRLATAVNSPTFTIDRGYAFNGTTQYINTGFAPNTHKVAMTGSNARLAIYERTNVLADNYAAGSYNGVPQGLLITPRFGSNTARTMIDSSVDIILGTVTDSRGLTAGYRSDTTNLGIYKNGASLGTMTSASNGTALPTSALAIGCFLNGVTPGSFRAASEGFVCVGASLSAAQELAQYNAVQAWATAVGAQV